MKIKYLLKIYLLLAIIFIISSCGSSELINSEKNSQLSKLSKDERKKKALDHFVNGSVLESQDKYLAAIAEYESALRYDTSAGIYFSLAKNYFRVNRLILSLNSIKKAVELDSTKIDYLTLLADVYTNARQYDSAIVVLNKSLEYEPNDVNTYYQLARVYELAKPLEAISIYEKIIDLTGPDWNIIVRIGELYEKIGNNDEALLAVKKLMEIDPSNNQLKKLVIDFCLKAEKYDEGLELADNILELDPLDLEALEKKALLLIGKDDWEAASLEFDKMLDNPAVTLDSKINIGATYFDKAVADSTLMPFAKRIFEKIDKDTSDWQVKMYLGAIATSEGNDSLAIHNFEYVTENARWNVQAWIRLGGLYYDNRKYEEASKIMTEAVESFPNDYAVNFILGLSLTQNNKQEIAEPYLKKSVELNPSDVNTLSAYGYTLNQLKRNEEAIEYIGQAIKLDPKNVELLGTLGLIYNSIEMHSESDSLYEKALSLDPNNALVNNNYSYALAERGEQLDRALRMVQISIEADSLNSSYLDTIGWVYFKLGEFALAKKYLEQAIEVGGESSVMIDHLADSEFKLGNVDRAKELWEKAFELDPTKIEIKDKIEKGKI